MTLVFENNFWFGFVTLFTNFFSRRASFVNLLVGFVVSLLQTGVGAAQDAQLSPIGACIAQENCSIPYDYLSSQEIDPFLFLGILVDRAHPRYREYKRAISKFPDALSCLDKTGRMSEPPNLLMIDWSNLLKKPDFEVCLFRIFRSLNNLASVDEWLRFHGFQTFPLRRARSESYQKRYELQPLQRIEGVWTTETTNKHFPTLLWKLFGLTLVKGSSVGIGVADTGQVVGVNYGITYE